MDCQIISIGNELLMGDTVNTNAGWLGQRLTDAGVEVSYVHTIGDKLDRMKSVLKKTLNDTDLVITTGGLGPTHDDITKKAVAEVLDCELNIDEEVLEFVKGIFKKRDIPFSDSNYYQAEVPECCEILFNSQGTAPGLWYEDQSSKLAVLPGVPYEMKYLTKNRLLPKIRSLNEDAIFRQSQYLITAGVGESTLSDIIVGDLSEVISDEVTVAYLPDTEGTNIRITGYGTSEKDIEEHIRPVRDYIEKKAHNVIIGEGKDCSLSEVVGKTLRNHNLSLATAESCTGGYIANEVTNIPGSSDYYKGGINAYANAVKVNQLGVEESVLTGHGAVSKAVALQMARGAACKLETDIGISTTGIAGPGGGTDEKPVGTVWIGFWNQNEHFALRSQFANKRLINKKRSAAVALETIRRIMLGISKMPYTLQKHPA